ncbi:MAG: treZ, partial [Rhodospirillales bacterium]|nr:treZ [Rhodospirillales bacterium]
TFRGAIENLDHLVATGITAIELMPVADFAGRWNWGYDGVLLFAPDSAYGTPEDLKALIDAAHERGLMVFLDVVYNHFGPEGNYLPVYAPDFFTKDIPTPWGAAIDYRVPEVRAFAVQNVLHWLRDYRFDGLRLDAVHAIRARGEPSILRVIAEAAGALAKAQDRYIHLILENDDNSADLLEPQAISGAYRAQWNDDYHHAWHVLITNETAGYYEDYSEPFAKLRRALTEGFVYQGEISKHRGGARRGQKSRTLSPLAFVNFLQNHDQIGNRPYGDRLEALAPGTAMEAALAITLLAPFPPMLFMGEEWGCRQPFPFFCDFTGDLARAVEEGRRREFAAIYDQAASGHEPPSALDPETFRTATLDWENWTKSSLDRYETVRLLLVARDREIVPRLVGARPIRIEIRDAAEPLVHVTWALADGSALTLLANLSAEVVPLDLALPAQDPFWGSNPTAALSPWQVVWWLEAL